MVFLNLAMFQAPESRLITALTGEKNFFQDHYPLLPVMGIVLYWFWFSSFPNGIKKMRS